MRLKWRNNNKSGGDFCQVETQNVLPNSLIPKKNRLSPLFFAMVWDIDLVCGCIMISCRSDLRFIPVQWFWQSYGPWTLKYGQIFSCHHFFSLCFEILTWILIYECIMMSYRSSLHFVLVQWFLAELWPLDFEILSNI